MSTLGLSTRADRVIIVPLCFRSGSHSTPGSICGRFTIAAAGTVQSPVWSKNSNNWRRSPSHDVSSRLQEAGAASKGYDGYLFSDGGIRVPPNGMLGWKIREHLGWLIGKYGKVGCTDLFRRKNVYNSSVKVGKAAMDKTSKMLAPFTIGGSSGSGEWAAGTARAHGSGRSLDQPKRWPGQAVRPYVADWVDEPDPVQGKEVQERRMEKKKKPEKMQRKSDECQEHVDRHLNSGEGTSSRTMPFTQSGVRCA